MEIESVQQNNKWDANGNGNGMYFSDDDDFEGGDSVAKLYERSRIKALAEERELVQKKTFTKWMNSHLNKVNETVDDLYIDLRDGKKLLKLLEMLSCEKLPRPTRGKMRIHCLVNVDKAINFLLEQHVHLENVGAHDIVDGSARLTLGLVWTIILRFQMQDIVFDEADLGREARGAKDALLLWCQMKTAGYNNVNVRNFTTSWRDGLAFSALVNKHCPELLDVSRLNKTDPVGNLRTVFALAEQLGVPTLMDPEDVCVEQPDEKSIMTYVVTLYHFFNRLRTESVQCKRVAKVLTHAMAIDELILQYDRLTSTLLDWIQHTIQLLDERVFANSLAGVQQQLAAFNTYRISEKPPKFNEKGNLEMLLFTIYSDMRANNQRPYVPDDCKTIADINRAWERLEKSEHERELCLREELIRQEKLDQLASRFDRKTCMREAWLSENQRLVTQDNFGSDLAAVEAATKKHEAIETDIFAYEERVNAVVTVAEELSEENYHDVERVNARKENVIEMWQQLLEMLKMRRQRLELSRQMQDVFQEMIYLIDWIDEIGNRLKSADYGKHLLGVDDLLQKHGLLETDIRVLETRKNQVLEEARIFSEGIVSEYRPAEPGEVERRCEELRLAYEALLALAAQRHSGLDQSKKMWQFLWEMDDDKEWIKEKSQLMSSPDLGHDLSSVERLLRKHRALEEDVRVRQGGLESGLERGEALMAADNWGKDRIKERIVEMKTLWAQLVDLTAERRQRLEESLQFYQLLTDCDDADAWMLDQVRMVSNEDIGAKLALTETLMDKHQALMDELGTFRESLDQLRVQGTTISEYPETDAQKIFTRLEVLDSRYDELIEMSKLRHQQLVDALAMYNLFSMADSVKTWITEKEKLLVTLVPSDELEELEVIRHRFECFESEMRTNAAKVGQVNELSRGLVTEEHPSTENIVEKQDDLNENWNELADMVEAKKRDIEVSYKYNQYLVEAQETANWIVEKEKLIESTDALGNDLEGIMQLQRRLGGLQRDLKAIEAKVEHLNQEADEINDKKPEVTEIVEPERAKIKELWSELKEMLKDRDDKLNVSSELQRFLQDLDHFQMWLRRAQTAVASEDIPSDLQEAEKLIDQHNQLKQEIGVYQPEFERLIGFGRKVTEGQDDSQYMFLNQRLNGIEESWDALEKMCDDREVVLNQSLQAQTFFKDARQMDVILSKLESAVYKTDLPTTVEAVDEAIKQHENVHSSALSNEQKIDSLLDTGNNLISNNNFNLEKIQNKCEQIAERRDAIRRKSLERSAQLEAQHELQVFNQEVDDVEEWITEKMIVASDDSYRDLQNVSARYGRFKAFEEELGANKDKIEKVINDGVELINARPQFAAVIQPKIDELAQQWADLNNTAQDKSLKMADANREIIFKESAKSMNEWIDDVSAQIITTEEEEEIGLVQINEQLQDQEKKDKELEQKRKMLTDMESHAIKLKEQYPEREEEIEQMQQEVRVKLTQVEAPLSGRRDKLSKQKRIRQFFRDIEDEKQWIEEKLNLVHNNGKIGDSLLAVQQLIRRLKTLSNEIENHRPRIEVVCDDGNTMISEGHPQSDKFQNAINELWDRWDELQQKVLEREGVLDDNLTAQQYLFDASEAESWMGEQELYLMSPEKAKDGQGANNLMKKHHHVEKMVENYADEIRSLGERSQVMMQTCHPLSDVVAQKQSRVDKMYAGLRDLCSERQFRLEENVKLFHLLKEIQDLELWIAERIVLASSHEMGSDFEHCCLLRDRFAEFAKDTNAVGAVRITAANELCDSLINQGHAESAEIAQWKDRINESWADLLELIETRIQLLKAAWDLHKFLSDCQDLLDRIGDKRLVIPDEVGRDAKSVAVYQRKHLAFELEVHRLGQQVESAVDTANHLLPLYAGQKERMICDRRDELLQAWRELQMASEFRKVHLLDSADLHRFLSMIRELLQWMQEIRQQMDSKEKPKDVAGVDLLVNNHRSLKAEIDAREENFSICLSLGRTLLNRRHPRENDIREKCIEVVTARVNLMDQWTERWDYLHLILEVYQFARDAAVAESWLLSQSTFLSCQDLGENLDETLALLKKHIAFERAVMTQEERFEALKKLTAFEIRARETSPEAKEIKEENRKRKIADSVKEFHRPPTPVIDMSESVVESQVASQVMATASEKQSEKGKRSPTKKGSLTHEGTSSATFHEGMLSRKHEWESATKKASGRSWHELYVVLNDGLLSTYKDSRHYKERPAELYHHESSLSLSGARAAPATDYTKRANVFRVRLANGGEFLFQSKNDADMNDWVSRINAVSGSDAGDSGSVGGGHRSSTLPAQQQQQQTSATTGGTSDSGKKKFFTLGRKK